jgi:hypothetical protein
VLPKLIQKHEDDYQCAVRISVDPVSVSGCVAARDRRATTSAHRLSANDPAPPDSTGRPYVLVLAFALLVGLAERTLVFVQPRTVIAWQRKRFRDYWAKLSKQGRPDRPPVAREIRTLIRKMSADNTRWGAPRIVGELRKLGIDVSKSPIDKYRVRSKQPPSPTWKTFLKNHVTDLVSIDFFVVPTERFKMLFVLVVLAHHRRRVVHFNVTEHPTAQWTG